MIAVEVNGRDAKFTWEIIGTYRAPNEEIRRIVLYELYFFVACVGC
jgi:hypothetical protein